ncbi:diacylglycerol kinase family protein [Geothrix sp. PMB-07]|uniref:diacylglycerol/lipid kinase family protein n=1 Tax=Geothrix sp. PMB-07 TaxID=3068640 RepID=UPI002741F27B|nr:diacylglycerol kinase family protein [Geothrix sp. PMB-07]WLT30343.1 diacylglycerol kinase family protein [Geothrix sp. PMB-07]
MKAPLLFNAASGSSPKDPDALLRALPKVLREQVEPLAFGPPWDFEPAIAQAQAAGLPLFVWGGDGTLHHAAKALIQRGNPVPLAAIPGGSGNGLVRGLRTPLQPSGALQRLLEGRELRMDLPRLDGEPFLNLCGTGFEAAVAHRFAALPGRGFSRYARACLSLWRSWPSVPLAWEAETSPMPTDPGRLARIKAAFQAPPPDLPESAWSLCFANLPQYGSGLWIAPGADPTDGALQWATLARPSLLDLMTEGPSLFREGGRSSLRREGRFLRATLRLDHPLPWHLDGEPAAERDRAELSVESRTFRMQVTQACPWE